MHTLFSVYGCILCLISYFDSLPINYLLYISRNSVVLKLFCLIMSINHSLISSYEIIDIARSLQYVAS